MTLNADVDIDFKEMIRNENSNHNRSAVFFPMFF
jgi:hypothetical protein